MQVRQLPWFLVSPILRAIHDGRKHRYIRLTEGARPLTGEIAVLLIFQPKGLLESTLHTLDHLHAKGVSALVVSNAPIAEPDLWRLQAHAWLVMERPNYGYDFGGYRDAILHILDRGLTPSRLFVLNDSIWFPLGPDSDLIDHTRASGDDLYGFVLNDRYEAVHRKHIQSYFFSFGGRLVAHPDFRRYWRKLFVTNNKNLVIRRCEIPMTHAFRSRGHSVGYRHTYADVRAALKTLGNADLRRVIEYQIEVDTSNARRLRPCLAADVMDDAWRDAVLEAIDRGTFGKYFLIAHPMVLIGRLARPMLKKDRQPMYRLQRKELIAGGYAETLAPAVRAEIETWDQR